MRRTATECGMRCAIATAVLAMVGLVGARSASAQGSNTGPGNPTVLDEVRVLQSQLKALTTLVEELAEKAGTTPGALESLPTSWSRKLPASERFRLVLDDQAVLDVETGLVWERTPSSSTTTFDSADNQLCNLKSLGGRMGWRVPTLWEIATLIDDSQTNPSLPVGHPFDLGTASPRFWTTAPFSIGFGASSVYVAAFDLGFVGTTGPNTMRRAWCVRAPGGVSPFSPTIQ